MEPKPQSDAMEYPGYLHVVVEGEKFFLNSVGMVSIM
jgi:hypothetical protein